jgi:cytochrome c oxidase subunit 4
LRRNGFAFPVTRNLFSEDQMAQPEPTQEDNLTVEHEHTTHSQGFYLAIGAILLVLTVTTAVVAFINLGPFNPVVALLIATIKATLVVLFFMHVKGASEKMTGVVVISGFFFLAILLTLSLADYMTRSWR